MNPTKRIGLFIVGLIAIAVAFAPIAPVEHVHLELVGRYLRASAFVVIGVFAIGTSLFGRDQRS
jgi:hypothetical protein